MNIYTKINRGFTLIELLVVIAIIGILASVVLASLNTARDKGTNAAIKANLNGARVQAEIVYDNATPNSYDAVCGDTNINSALTAANNANGAGAAACADDSDEWVLHATLVGTPTQYYCVDYKGNATTTNASVGGTAGGDLDCD